MGTKERPRLKSSLSSSVSGDLLRLITFTRGSSGCMLLTFFLCRKVGLLVFGTCVHSLVFIYDSQHKCSLPACIRKHSPDVHVK